MGSENLYSFPRHEVEVLNMVTVDGVICLHVAGAVVGLAIVMLLVGYSFGVGLMLLAHRRLMHERAPAFLDNPLRELHAQNGKLDSSDADSEMMKEPSASQIGMDSHEPTGAASEHPYVNVSLES